MSNLDLIDPRVENGEIVTRYCCNCRRSFMTNRQGSKKCMMCRGQKIFKMPNGVSRRSTSNSHFEMTEDERRKLQAINPETPESMFAHYVKLWA